MPRLVDLGNNERVLLKRTFFRAKFPQIIAVDVRTSHAKIAYVAQHRLHIWYLRHLLLLLYVTHSYVVMRGRGEAMLFSLKLMLIVESD